MKEALCPVCKEYHPAVNLLAGLINDQEKVDRSWLISIHKQHGEDEVTCDGSGRRPLILREKE
jgi:hypothetical protein